MKIKIGDLRKLIRESLGDEQPFKVDFLYHGTTEDRAEQIREEGFSTENIGEKLGAPLPGISTTIDPDIANEHAEIASEKFEGNPEVIKIDGRRLRIAPGSLYFRMWDEVGDSNGALKKIKATGDWDGIALFDPETGDGIEEYEVLVFDPSKIMISR